MTVGGKPLRYTFEALGHAKAYDFMFTLFGSRAITEKDILTMHQMFYEGIEQEYAGTYRKTDVFISGGIMKPVIQKGGMGFGTVSPNYRAVAIV